MHADGPGWNKWKPAFGYAVAFPDGDYKIEAHPNSPLDITIDRRDMDTLADRVAKIMDRWGNAQPAAAPDGMRALQETMGYRIEVIAPLGVRFDDAERTMIELTEEQSGSPTITSANAALVAAVPRAGRLARVRVSDHARGA